MSAPDLYPVVSGGIPWFAWEPLTPANVMLVALAIYGLYVMHGSCRRRNRQDAQTEMLTTQTAALRSQTEALQALLRGLDHMRADVVGIKDRLMESGPPG